MEEYADYEFRLATNYRRFGYAYQCVLLTILDTISGIARLVGLSNTNVILASKENLVQKQKYTASFYQANF